MTTNDLDNIDLSELPSQLRAHADSLHEGSPPDLLLRLAADQLESLHTTLDSARRLLNSRDYRTWRWDWHPPLQLYGFFYRDSFVGRSTSDLLKADINYHSSTTKKDHQS